MPPKKGEDKKEQMKDQLKEQEKQEPESAKKNTPKEEGGAEGPPEGSLAQSDSAAVSSAQTGAVAEAEAEAVAEDDFAGIVESGPVELAEPSISTDGTGTDVTDAKPETEKALKKDASADVKIKKEQNFVVCFAV